jgi:aconitate hydratase
MVAGMVRDRQTKESVSFDVNPSSREIFEDLTRIGATFELIKSGARIHQAGCMGCIGMGQAPAVGHNSLRTFPRNFPGRSGTQEDRVWLCSPETAAAAALTGVITDPRDLAEQLDMAPPELNLPEQASVNTSMLVAPVAPDEAKKQPLERGPNISTMPDSEELPDKMELPVLLKMGDDISTDEISPAGAQALPYRSNIPKLAEFTFRGVDKEYPERARRTGRHAVVAGENYGQGSSREHAAITPRYLGLAVVIAKSYARIHWQNLANFGVLALEFAEPDDLDRIDAGDVLRLDGLRDALQRSGELSVSNTTKDEQYPLRYRLSARQVEAVLAGGRIPLLARS